MTDLHILLDSVTSFWKCLKKVFKKLVLDIVFKVDGIILKESRK